MASGSEPNGLDPEGIAAISRGLSGATPPEEIKKTKLHPEGMPDTFRRRKMI